MATVPGSSRRTGEPKRTEALSGDQNVICACRNVSYGTIRTAILAGATTIDALQAETGAGTECGSCLLFLERIVGTGPTWRPVTVERSPAAEGIHQLWLTLREGTGPAPLPGQHLRVRVRIAGEWHVRAYTVTSVAADGQLSAWEITVKRMPSGFVSHWLSDRPVEELEVEISRPRGSFCWPGPDPEQPAVCLVAGIGVTPALAFARHAASIRCRPGLLHIDCSVRSPPEVVAAHELHAYAEAQCLSLKLRITGGSRQLGEPQIREIAAEWPTARFYVCGPPSYIESVVGALVRAGVARDRVRVEDFEGPISSVTAPLGANPDDESTDVTYLATPGLLSESGAVVPPTMRARRPAYAAGFFVAAATLVALALPATTELHARGPANTGHDTLGCVDCHAVAPGTTRQQLQGRVRYVFGLRETPVHVGHVPVENATCIGCHDNPDDRHPVHRFGEPRFAEVRADLGADRCVSCHDEHDGGRVTVGNVGFCVGCHTDLEVADDPASPSHAELVENEQWSTCLGCHDFHGNHVREVPTDLADAVSIDRIELYFDGGESPYGDDRPVTARPGSGR